MNVPKLTGKRCQCTACGEYFSRERAFDRHRIGDFNANRRCLTVAEMEARGWRRNNAGCWINEALDTAGRTRIRPESVAPLPQPLPTARAPELQTPAGSP